MTDERVDEKTIEDEGSADLAVREAAPLVHEGGDSAVPTQLGAGRYVMAGFFAAGMALAFVVSKVLSGTWNRLADNTWVAQHAPFLGRVAEDDRPTLTSVVGAAVAIFTVISAYKKPGVRTWTNEVAAELAKVSWPSKKEVTNSTMVVIAASAFATVFLALLDRFWGFVTNLVYGS